MKRRYIDDETYNEVNEWGEERFIRNPDNGYAHRGSFGYRLKAYIEHLKSERK